MQLAEEGRRCRSVCGRVVDRRRWSEREGHRGEPGAEGSPHLHGCRVDGVVPKQIDLAAPEGQDWSWNGVGKPAANYAGFRSISNLRTYSSGKSCLGDRMLRVSSRTPDRLRQLQVFVFVFY